MGPWDLAALLKRVRRTCRHKHVVSHSCNMICRLHCLPGRCIYALSADTHLVSIKQHVSRLLKECYIHIALQADGQARVVCT